MNRKIRSIKGLFDQIIHYEDGIKVGERWLGLFRGSLNHYDADGKYIGYSDRGTFVEQVHHDEHGNYIGETRRGFFCQKKHYSADHGYVGETWECFVGDTADLVEISDSRDCDDFFDDSEW